jgi:hypothetical protein
MATNDRFFAEFILSEANVLAMTPEAGVRDSL